ncbi:MAG: hypothetical protein GX320_08875 [Tissierellia bacterium]|nr:hypothetical protein [Tissierellia bacterium]
MLSVLLNIVGLIFIALSLFFINKISQEEKDIYNEIRLIYNDIKDYSLAIDNTLDSFYELVQTNLKKIDNLNSKNRIIEIDDKATNKKNKQINKIFEDNDEGFKDSSESLYREIISLREIGFSNEEIAKRLNKGVREVEIIIKMWGNINL